MALGAAVAGGGLGTQPAPPSTDVYLVAMPSADGAWDAASALNISSHADYDNQPSFAPDGASILFTSRRDGQQTDIYRYVVASRTLHRLTETAESEYSPTTVPAGDGFSVIRVEADNTQRLWKFDADGANPSLLLPDVRPVGYHAWASDDTLLLFVLGEPATLQRARVGTPGSRIVARDIGRAVLPMPGGQGVSYTARGEDGTWRVWKYDPRTDASTPLVDALEGSADRDCAWTPDGRLLMARDTTIHWWRPGRDGWTPLVDLAPAGVRNVSRMAVSPDGRWLAFVGVPAN